MKWIGTDWFGLDAEEIKSYVGTARGVFASPGIQVFGDLATPSCRVDIHRSHLPLFSGASLPTAQPEDNHEIPEASRGWLRPFQLEAVAWLRERRGAILALDLGGGKTATVTAAADLPVCVLMPLSVVDVWKTECRRLGWTWHFVDDVQELKDALKAGKTDCYIMPYSRADKCAGYFTAHRMGTVIADEAHVLTNKYVTWTQAFRAIPRERTYLLTATPMRNRLSSLWGLLDAASPRAFGTRNDFRVRYCGAQPSPYGGFVDTAATNQEELAQRLSEVVYKRSRAQMKIPLPTHRRELLSAPVPGGMFSLEELLKFKLSPSAAQLTLLGKQRQHLSTKKAESVDLRQFMREHARVVFWVWFKETAKILQERFKDEFQYTPVDMMTGESPTKKRSAILEEWAHPKSVGVPRVLIASVAAASMGISLANAEAAVFVDLDWTPLNLLQAEKRHYRFGSMVPELVTYYMVTPGSIDEPMAQALVEKQLDSEGVLGEDGSVEQMKFLLDNAEEMSETEIIQNMARRMFK